MVGERYDEENVLFLYIFLLMYCFVFLFFGFRARGGGRWVGDKKCGF